MSTTGLSDLLKVVPLPTIDRPFGVQLWPYFDKAFTAIKGYHPQDFRFEPHVTPISTLKQSASLIVAYYIIVFGGREIMRNRPALKLNGIFKVHNFCLTTISAILLALFAEQLIPTVYSHGIFYAICEHNGGWTDELVILYYMNYLTKYLELLDTVFLVLKKKPLTFLHCYHHGATALLCYTQLVGATSVSWVVITLNLMVHVVMYWYYFQSARGIRIWWKEWITRLQIIQFVIDLGFVYFASYTYFTSTYFQWMPNAGSCAGEEFAAFSGMGILSSYLLLFISFYIATYKKDGKRPTGRKAARSLSSAEIPDVAALTNGMINPGKSHGHANGHANGRTEILGPASRLRRTNLSSVPYADPNGHNFEIKVPCSSANIGPGFDAIGLALSLYLELRVSVDTSKTSSTQPLNCVITYEDLSGSTEEISLDPESNLITRVALYLLRCHNQWSFPIETHIHIANAIPLSRGLGSSGTAVVAGVMLGNEIGHLGLTKARLLDYCLMIERHPDNIAATLFGGFVGTYLNELNPEDAARKEIPLSEVLPAPAGGINTGLKPPTPPLGIGHYCKFPWAKEIKAIAVIPDFVVPTAKAREVLPKKYTRSDIVYNLQRVALLPIALGHSPPDPDMIYLAMQDKLHQPYRKTLIPGLSEVLQSMTPKTQPGLLGICLSGAGPTILALATANFDEIAENIINHFKGEGISCQWKLLELAPEGAFITTATPGRPVTRSRKA